MNGSARGSEGKCGAGQRSGKKKRQRSVFRKWELTKRVLEGLGRRSANEKVINKEAAKNLGLECLGSSFRLSSGLYSEMTSPVFTMTSKIFTNQPLHATPLISGALG